MTRGAASANARERGPAAGHRRGGEGDFFRRVHAGVRRIPRGRVATYGQIAALLGSPRAGRTVGWALRGLSDDSEVPWHRVVDARGRIRLGSRGGAAALQAALLRREGVRVDAEGTVDLVRFGWAGPRR